MISPQARLMAMLGGGSPQVEDPQQQWGRPYEPPEYAEVRRRLAEALSEPEEEFVPPKLTVGEWLLTSFDPSGEARKNLLARKGAPYEARLAARERRLQAMSGLEQLYRPKGMIGTPAGLYDPNRGAVVPGTGEPRRPIPVSPSEGLFDPGTGQWLREPGQGGKAPEPWAGTQGRYMWDPEAGRVRPTPGMPKYEADSLPELVWGRFLDEGVNPVDPGHPLYSRLDSVAKAKAAAKGRKYDEALSKEARAIWRNAYNSSSLEGPDKATAAAETAIAAYQKRFGQAGLPQSKAADLIPPPGGAMSWQAAYEALLAAGLPESEIFDILYQKGY